MKHMNDEWEKVVRQEPFAASPFTEEHKQNVLRQVAWLKTGSAQEMTDAGDKFAEQKNCPIHTDAVFDPAEPLWRARRLQPWQRRSFSGTDRLWSL